MSVTNILSRLFQDDGSGQMLRPEIVPGNKHIGEIFFYAGTDIPSGALRLDGQSITGVSAAFPDFKAWVVEHGVLCTLEEYETELTAKEGQCGKFGWDADTDTLRLPTISKFVGGATSVSEIGTAVQSGLPNATGSGVIAYCGDNVSHENEGAISITQGMSTGATQESTMLRYNKINLDLSHSSPIYGRSPNSVTPPSVRYPFFIQVYNSAVGVSEAQAAEFASLVDGLRQDVPGMAAKAAMPASGTYIDISVPSSPTTWPAPSDGWVFFRRSVTGKGTISLINKNSTIESLLQVSETNGMGTFVPVNKDDIVEFSYQGTYFGSGLVARFIYANGSAPE